MRFLDNRQRCFYQNFRIYAGKIFQQPVAQPCPPVVAGNQHVSPTTPGLCPWTTLGDFHPPDSLLSPLANSWLRPCQQLLKFSPKYLRCFINYDICYTCILWPTPVTAPFHDVLCQKHSSVPQHVLSGGQAQVQLHVPPTKIGTNLFANGKSHRPNCLHRLRKAQLALSAVLFIVRPFYRPHYASCPSVCLSVRLCRAGWQLENKETQKKTKIGIDFPGARVSGMPVFS